MTKFTAPASPLTCRHEDTIAVIDPMTGRGSGVCQKCGAIYSMATDQAIADEFGELATPYEYVNIPPEVRAQLDRIEAMLAQLLANRV